MTHALIDGRAHEIAAEFDERRCGWWFRMPSLGIEFLACYTSASEDPDGLGCPAFLEAEVDCAAAGYDAHISIALGRSGFVTEDLFASAALKALRTAFPEVFAGFAGAVELPRAT